VAVRLEQRLQAKKGPASIGAAPHHQVMSTVVFARPLATLCEREQRIATDRDQRRDAEGGAAPVSRTEQLGGAYWRCADEAGHM
jgi:hypothetical protein